ncbi:MAG: peptidylprolyl isomerase, partial [Planctomycetota bacterium]
ERLRAARGLTDERLASLMERNAALRALVADDIDVTEEAVRLAYEREYGRRRVARVAVLATPGEADRFMRELRLGGSFEQLAMARSIDPTAGAGGLLPPLSRASEGVAGSVREAVWTTAVGSVSGRVAVPEGFAVVRVERELGPTGRPMAQVRAELERRVRLTGEAQAMRELAASILRGARVTVLDADLDASWSRYLDANAPAR